LRRSIFNSLINADALKSLKHIGADVGANKKGPQKEGLLIELIFN
jgi:hypothetical protein